MSASPIEIEVIARRLAERGAGQPPTFALDGARSSAVLVALAAGEEGPEVLLTRRSRHLSSHRGEVAFPGGRLDEGETPVDAALREAFEEVALDPSVPHVLGELDHLATVSSNSSIVPIVASLPTRPELRPAAAEVERVLFVPLADLLRPGTYREEWWGAPPLQRSVSFFDLDDETIWGATARMLVQLLSLGLGVEP